MNDREDDQEPVGSLSEEAMKLFSALSDWAQEAGDAYAGPADSASATFRSIDKHVATGGEDCRYCPVCRTISAVRATSPEVRGHLANAATSLFHAAAAAMATSPGNGSEAGDRVEKIDLDDE